MYAKTLEHLQTIRKCLEALGHLTRVELQIATGLSNRQVSRLLRLMPEVKPDNSKPRRWALDPRRSPFASPLRGAAPSKRR